MKDTKKAEFEPLTLKDVEKLCWEFGYCADCPFYGGDDYESCVIQTRPCDWFQFDIEQRFKDFFGYSEEAEDKRDKE